MIDEELFVKLMKEITSESGLYTLEEKRKKSESIGQMFLESNLKTTKLNLAEILSYRNCESEFNDDSDMLSSCFVGVDKKHWSKEKNK